MGLTNTQYDTIMRDYQRQQARDHDEHARRQAAVYERFRNLRRLMHRSPPRAQPARDGCCWMETLLHLRPKKTLLVKQPCSASCVRPLISYQADAPRFLQEAGFPADYLEPVYRCPDCRDTGYIGNENATASVRLSLTFSICSPTCARR